MGIVSDHLNDTDTLIGEDTGKKSNKKDKEVGSLLDKLKKSGQIKVKTVAESTFFKPKDIAPTRVPIINVAFNGELTGGVSSGLLLIAGKSRHFKSNLGLVGVHAYMNTNPDAVCLFYDSEFGITPEYLVAHGIDNSRVLHIPITNIEEFKFDIVQRINDIQLGDKVIIFIDSLGNLPSKKECDNAMENKSSADMTRSRELKSLTRMITGELTVKNIPCIAICHTYTTLELYAKDVISGGTGLMYSSNAAWIIGRSQEKDGTELLGYNFTINIEKSRFVKEKSKLSFLVKFDGGISKYSGLLDLALESGAVRKPANGWYSKVDTESGEIEDKKYREADTHTKDFWNSILLDKTFHEFVKNKYKLAVSSIQDLTED